MYQITKHTGALCSRPAVDEALTSWTFLLQLQLSISVVNSVADGVSTAGLLCFFRYQCVGNLVLGSADAFNQYQSSAPLLAAVYSYCCTLVIAVFTLNRPFYPSSSVHPVSVLIPHPREILILWSQTVRQRKTKNKTKSQIQVSSKWSVSVPGTRTQQHKQDRKNKSKKTIKQKKW